MRLTDITEAVLLRDMIATGSPFGHASAFVGLATTDPTEDHTNYDGEENIPSNYSRVSLGTDVSLQQDANGNYYYVNDRDILFSNHSSSDWPSIVGVTLFDAESVTTGNKLCYAPISPTVVPTGSSYKIPAGGLTVGIEGEVSGYTAHAWLDNLLGLGSGMRHSTAYAALFDGDPEGSGTEVSTSLGYGRPSVSWETISQVSGRMDVSNDAAAYFGTAGGGTWSVSWLALFDSSSGGNLLCSAPLGTSVTVQDGENFTLQAGQITDTLG